jgi:hypothetical protein
VILNAIQASPPGSSLALTPKAGRWPVDHCVLHRTPAVPQSKMQQLATATPPLAHVMARRATHTMAPDSIIALESD